MLRSIALSAVSFAAATSPAVAHPGHEYGASSLLAGFAHPLTGIDHVVAMVAVGVWAASLGGRALWAVPAALAANMIGGFALAVMGFNLPFVEAGIATSILVFGMLAAAAARLPLAIWVPLVGIFAVLHGYAHGTEIPGNVPAFGLGLVAASIVLHAAGISLCRVLDGPRLILTRSLGSIAAAIGLALLGGLP